MNFLKIACFYILYSNCESYIIGPEKEIKEHNKYLTFKNNKEFQRAKLIVFINEEEDFIKHPFRPSRNIFGYTKYTICIYQNEKLVYKKTFRLSSFDATKRNLVLYNEKKHIQNRKNIVNYAFDLLCLAEYSNPNEITNHFKNTKLIEPTSHFILFNENGNMKALNLNFQDFNHAIKIKEPLNIIPYILNKHKIKLIKSERIYNHGIYSYITIDNIVIKLANKNYFKNLYNTLLKIEIIYLIDQNIFTKDASIFFIEFDKLSDKTSEELITIKKNLRPKSEVIY